MDSIRLNNKGFTLIEALIAMFVLTIGILALNMMQITSTKGNTSANQMTRASVMGGNAYERLLNVDYDDPVIDTGGNPHDNTEFANPALQLPANVTSVTWNVAEWSNTDGVDNDGDGVTDETDEMNIKNITLNINYTDRTTPRTITINLLKSELL